MNLSGRRVNLQIVKVGGAIEELESCRYDLTLIDKANTVITVSVLGIDRIFTDITPIEVSGVIKLFEGVSKQDLDRPEEGEIDCLIGYEYAAFHPVRKRAAGHLLLLENRFGMIIGGTHPTLKERTRKVLQHATIHHAMVRVEDFYKLEQLGVKCTRKYGLCRWGQCHPGRKSMTLKEEREYKIIKDKLTYKADQKKWEAGYPWIKDPKALPDNKEAALATLKATEKRLRQNPAHAAVYHKKIKSMIDRGVAHKLTKKEIEDYNGPVFYISRHEVLKPESKTTPYRIVFNSSANFHGHMLNESMLKAQTC